MMGTIIDVKNATWANEEHTQINVTITDTEYGDIPFTASPDDPEIHGRVLFNAAVTGEFGMIAEYVSPLTAEQHAEIVVRVLTDAVRQHLATTAQDHGYDDIVSACSYAASINAFQAEGVAFLAWRTDVWLHHNQVIGEVNAGTRSAPTAAELVAELPALVL